MNRGCTVLILICSLIFAALGRAADVSLSFSQQPGNRTVGTTFSPAIKVQILDGAGNPTNSAATVTLAIGNNPGGGSLTGTTSVAAVAGVATFTNLKINKAGSGYTLVASSSGLTAATSSAFTLTPGNATHYSLSAPASATAVASFNVTVTALDAFENVATGYVGTAKFTVSGNSPGNTALTNGSVTVSFLIPTPSASASITATDTVTSTITGSTTLAIVPGPTTKFQVFFPSSPTAGTPINVTVNAKDALNNSTPAYTGTVRFTSTDATAILPADSVITNGTGVFLATLKIATSATVTATDVSTPSIKGSTAQVTVRPANPSQLVFVQNPSNVVAGAVVSPSVSVKLLDPYGNATSSNAAVTLAIGTNPAGSSLSGTTTVAASSGTATFSTLNLNKSGSEYTLIASSPGVTSATSTPFSVSPAAASRLVFDQGPINSSAGTWLTPPVTVRILDSFGNLTPSTTNVAIAIGANPGSSVLAGMKSVAAVAGTATFPKLSLDKPGTGYTLSASSPGLTGVTSGTFNLAASTANRFEVMVFAAPTAGSSYTGSVRVLDSSDNQVTGYSGVVNLDCSDPAAVRPNQVTVVNGIGSFDITPKTSGGQNVTAYDDRSTIIGTALFTVSPSTPASLAFSQQPTSATAGAPLSPAVAVSILDAYGNVTRAGLTVSLEIGSNPGGGTLLGTKSQAAVSGVATFPDLNIQTAGSNYTLIATLGSLPTVGSSGFNITPGVGSRIVFGQQPTNCVAGQPFSPVVTARLLDAFGNLTTSSSSVSLYSTGKGSLNSNFSQSLATGTASFTTSYLTEAGPYRLRLQVSGIADQPFSDPFEVLPGPLLGLSIQGPAFPSVASVGLPIPITVRALDNWGNFVTAYSGRVHFTCTDSAAVLPPDSQIVNGQTIFPVTFRTAGVQNLIVTDTVKPTLTAQTGSLTVNTDATTKLVITQQPGNSIAGQRVSPLVRVQTQDALGNPTNTSVRVTLTLKSNPGGATLTGAPTLGGTGFVAFNDLYIDKVGTGYTLEASAIGLTGTVSAPFNITAGAASQLGFLQAPVNTVAGSSITPAVKVQVLDDFGNPTAEVKDITLAIGSNPAGGTLLGTKQVASTAGVSTFGNLSIAKSAPGYTLTASSSGLTSATSPTFDIVPGPATQMVFTQQPGTTVAGTAIAPALTVKLLDALGNLTTSTATVTLGFGTNPGNTSLTGTTAVAAIGGIATFPNVSLTKVATGYTLIATSGALSTTSSAFDVVAAAAARVAFTTSPSSAVAGNSIGTAVVQIQDQFGNPRQDDGSVTLTISNNPGGGSLSGTTTTTTVAGIATFTELSIVKSGTGYTLRASSQGLADGTSAAFNITPAAAAKLGFGQQPSDAVAGVPFSPAVTVQVQDAFGNVTPSTASVQLAIGNNPVGGTLSGSFTASAVGGTATFNTVNLHKIGVGYTLTAASSGLTGATSNPFTITHSPVTNFQVVIPANSIAGVTVSGTVTALDQFNNFASDYAVADLRIENSQAIGLINGKPFVDFMPMVNGVASFTAMFKTRGIQTVTARANGFSIIGVANTTVAAGPATEVRVSGSMANAVAGVTISPAIAAYIVDQFGNRTTDTFNVTLGITTNPVGGSFTGNLTVAAVDGIATFPRLWIEKAGIGYRVSASAPGVPAGGESAAFNITPAAAHHLAFLQPPVNTVAGASMAPAVKVQVLDVYNNQTADARSIAVSIGTNPAAGILAGTTSVTSSSGLSTFSNLSIAKASPGYTLTASTSGLTSATSAAFEIIPGPPAQLVFTQQPGNTVAGVSLAPSMSVKLLDALGNLTTSTADVTLDLVTNPGNTTLLGATTVAAVGGVATFPDISLTKAATGYALRARSAALSVTSSTFNITSAPPTHLTVVTDTPTITAGLFLPYTVTALDAFENIATAGYPGGFIHTCTDPKATLPESRFLLAKGVGHFNAVLKTGGPQTITVSPVGFSSISATSNVVTVEPLSNLYITDSTGPSTVVPGTVVTYTLKPINLGPSPATHIVVTDTLPAGTTFVSATPATGWTVEAPAVGAGGTVKFLKADMDENESAVLTLQISLPPSMKTGVFLTNKVTMASDMPDPTPSNNSISISGVLTGIAAIPLTYTVSADPVVAGTNTTFTLDLVNNGPSDAENVTFSSSFLGFMRLVSATAPSDWTRTGSQFQGNFKIPILPLGATARFIVVGSLLPTVPGGASTTFNSSVTSSTSGTKGSISKLLSIVRSTDLALTLTNSPDPVNITENVTYALGLTNLGSSDASDVLVNAPLPANTTFVSATAPDGWTLVNPDLGSAGSVQFRKSTLAASATGAFTIVAKVDRLAPDQSILTLTANVSTPDPDPVTENNFATSTTRVKSSADLAVTGSAPDSNIAGTDITYIVQVVNNGPMDAVDAVVTAVLPTGLTFVSAVVPEGWTRVSPDVGANGSVVFTRPLLANSASAEFTIVAHILSSLREGDPILTGLAATSSVQDIVTGNSSTAFPRTIHTSSDLEVTLAATPDPVVAGEKVTYAITVTNHGPSDAAMLRVSDVVPPHMTYVSSIPDQGWTVQAPASGATGEVDFSRSATLTSGTTSRFNIVTKVDAGTRNGTRISNSTSVSSNESDPAPSDNRTSITVAIGTVQPSPGNLQTSGTLNRQNGLFELSVTVTNTTPDPINGFRLHADYRAYAAAFPSLRLYNASSLTPDPYVDYPFPVQVDGSVTLKLQFYTSTRTLPNPFSPVLTLEKLAVSQLPTAFQKGVSPTLQRLPDKTVLLEFPSIPGHWYRVRYSSDLQTWYESSVPIQAANNRTQWIDNGPPFTNVSPADPSVTCRYYLLNEIPSP